MLISDSLYIGVAREGILCRLQLGWSELLQVAFFSSKRCFDRQVVTSNDNFTMEKGKTRRTTPIAIFTDIQGAKSVPLNKME